MKKIFLILAIVVLIIVGGILSVIILQQQPASFVYTDTVELDQREKVALMKPTVVRIVQEFKGEAQITPFLIDLETFEKRPHPNKDVITVPFDETFTGSGFIVHEDGYIATNAHVVAHETIKLGIAGAVIEEVITASAFDLFFKQGLSQVENSTEEIDNLSDKELQDVAMKLFDHFASQSTFTFEEQKTTVLDPRSEADDLDALVEKGFAAEVISVNNDFHKDDRDVALLKIDEEKLPVAAVNGNTGRAVGDDVTIFGFPGTAQFNYRDLLEPTLTQGNISAIKRSQKDDFDIVQTDAKVSQGSSGGPLFDENGVAIGTISFQSNVLEGTEGDQFAFAVPSGVLLEGIDTFRVTEDAEIPATLGESAYARSMKEIKQLVEQRRCQRAQDRITQVRELHTSFLTEEYTEAYKEECDAIITAGESIDSAWDEKRQQLSQLSLGTKLLIGGGIVVIVLLVIIALLVIRMRKGTA